MTKQRVPLRDLSPEQRQQRLAKQRADAEQAMREHEEKQLAFHANREKLKTLRLARDRGMS
jgi:hypothetical protein